MARGLLNGSAQGTPVEGKGAPAAPQGNASSAQGAPDEESSNVTPEEQAQYDTFVTNGMNLLYDDKAMPQVLQTIAGTESPVEGLANALAMVVMRLEDSAEKSGTEISGDVKFHGATELMGQLVELAATAGVHEFSEEEQEQALYLALDIYRTTRQEQGRLPEDELQQDMQMLLQAEQQGNLDQILPGISEFAANAPKPPAGGGAPPAGRRG